MKKHHCAGHCLLEPSCSVCLMRWQHSSKCTSGLQLLPYVQGGVFGLLTGSQVARFALPAPEPPEGMPSSALAPSMEPSAQLQEQTHSLQPASNEVNSTAAKGPVQTAQQPVASEALLKPPQPREQLPGHVPSSGQSAPALKDAPEAAQSGGSPALPASSAPVQPAPPVDTEPEQAASAKPAEEVEAATQPTGIQLRESAAASFSHPSIDQPNEADTQEQAGNAESLQPDVHRAPSELDDSRQEIPPQSTEGLKVLGELQASAESIAHPEAEQPASVPQPADEVEEVSGNETASAQPAAEVAEDSQVPSDSARHVQHHESASQSQPDSVRAPRPPIERDDSNEAAKAEKGTADGEQHASAAGQADNPHPRAQQEQPEAVAATPAGMKREAEPAPEASGDRKAGSVRGAEENGDSGHSMALSVPRETEQVQHGETSGSMPDMVASSAPVVPSLAKEPIQYSRKPGSSGEEADSVAMPKQEASSQEGAALTDSSAPPKGSPARASQMGPSGAGSAEHSGHAATPMHKPAVEPSAPIVSPSGSTVLDDRASAESPPKQVVPAVQPPIGRVGNKQVAMGAATSSGTAGREPAAQQFTQGTSRNTASITSKTEPPAGPSVSRSTSAAKQAPQSGVGSSVSNAAADPLQALLGDTQPRLARPPPKLTQPLSSGPLPRQRTSSGAAAGKERVNSHGSPWLTPCMSEQLTLQRAYMTDS